MKFLVTDRGSFKFNGNCKDIRIDKSADLLLTKDSVLRVMISKKHPDKRAIKRYAKAIRNNKFGIVKVTAISANTAKS